MLKPVTILRNSSRLLIAAGALALALLALCVTAFATGGLDRGEKATHHRTALHNGHNAWRRIGLARQAAAVNPGAGIAAPGPTPNPVPATPSSPIDLPVANEGANVPGVTGPIPSPEPPPPPVQSPEPPPPPVQSPEPPPPPPPPAPEPEPEPEPSPPPSEPEPEPNPPPQRQGEVLFAATFDEDGFGGWYLQSLPGRASISSNSFEGTHAARFEVRAGDVEPDTGSQRSEVSGPTFNQGEDLFIRDAIRIPSSNTYDAPWEIIEQLHEEDWSGSPGMAIFLEPAPSLRIGAGDGSPVFWKSGALEANRWYDLVYRVNLSQDPSTGFVEVWLDGVQQTLTNGQARMYGQTIQAAQTYLKAGIYRSKSSTGTSIVEHDSIVVGTSLEAVNSVVG